MIELLLVIAILLIVGTYLFLGSGSLKSKNDLESARRQTAALLREAQQRSISGSSGTSWGVMVNNVVSTSSYVALFVGTFSTATIANRFTLPSTIRFNTSSLPIGASRTYMFAQLTGLPSTSTSIVFEQVSGAVAGASATITFSSSGMVGY